MRQQKEAPDWPANNSPFLQIGHKVFALQAPLGCEPVFHRQGCCLLHRTSGKPSFDSGVQTSIFHLCLGSIFVLLLVGLLTPGSSRVLATKAQPELTTAQCARDLVSVPLALGSPFTLTPLPVSHHGFWPGLCPIFRQKLAKRMDWEVASASTKTSSSAQLHSKHRVVQGGGEAQDERGPSQGARPVLIRVQQTHVEGPQTLTLSVDTPRTAQVVLASRQQALGRQTCSSFVQSQPQGTWHTGVPTTCLLTEVMPH